MTRKKIEHDAVCAVIRAWAALASDASEGEAVRIGKGFHEAWQQVDLAISKSCLLDRMLNLGLRPSVTRCPVHKGNWSGCHNGWPGDIWVGVGRDGKRTERPMDVAPRLQEWHDAGCRCHLHGCGCTTGWNPDGASHGTGYPR